MERFVESGMTDPIVEEIHKIREEHAAQFNYDLAALVEDLQKEEEQSGRKFVSYPPRLLTPEKGMHHGDGTARHRPRATDSVGSRQ